jgi:hypothetical protein
MMSRTLGLLIVMSVVCLAGCGSGDNIWVTGMLQKGGEMYKPPDGHKLALYFCPMPGEASAAPTGDVAMADYDPRDGSFTVPGREGNGIPPGKYRIAVVETLRREALDQLKEASKSKKRGQQTPIRDDTNLLETSFGEKASPFVRDLTTSTKLLLDMAKPNG